MMLSQKLFSTEHAQLLDALAASKRLLIIQDLDGVCMGLVREPLTRVIDRAYVEAAHALGKRFQVLTNGEHIGSRGVNAIVAAAVERSEEHTSELQSLMRTSYAVFCLNKQQIISP